MERTFVIGSRGSQLALWQAHYIAARLAQTGVRTRIEIIRTTGDRMQTMSLVKAGGKGLFTKEIEEALLRREIDLAVHSLKDLPTQNTTGLTLAAIPEREDPRDALVGAPLLNLKHGARIGTSSNRRAAQLRMLRADLLIDPVRGNVDTRLRKLGEGQLDGLMLAAAGLRRLGLAHHIAQVFTPQEICPAPGQGALAVQTRVDDEAAMVCRSLDHAPTDVSVRCERAVLSALGGGCELPIGAFAVVEGDTLQLVAGVFSPDGIEGLRTQEAGSLQEPETLGRRVAEQLLARGAHRLLATADHG